MIVHANMVLANRRLASVFASGLTVLLPAFIPSVASAEDTQAEIAKKLNNPVAAMYSVPIQYNWNKDIGPDENGYQSLTNIQPVLPFSLNENWNLISRTIMPVIAQHGALPNGRADADGVGDVTQSFFFSPKEPTADGWIWGAGPVILLPTGSDELLSQKQTGLGPTAVLLKQSHGWTVGALANHIWGLNGEPPDHKEKVSATYLQPFLCYTTSTYTTFGVNTESTYNWQTQEWSVPVNLFATQLFKVGNQPMSLQFGPRYWVDQEENGAHGWGFRLAYTLVFLK